MSNRPLYRIKTISEYHKIMGLPKPKHPLISVIDMEDITKLPAEGMGSLNLSFDLYSISLKRAMPGMVKFKYGQQEYDFDEGVMFFMAPGQVFGIEVEEGIMSRPTGYMLYVHPGFLWHTPLAKAIKQ
jgi:AraC family transcriptional activator of pobA